jgi:hypothetical protein
VVIQVVALIIQLAVAALMPLMPIITIVANLFAMLIRLAMPIIQILVTSPGSSSVFAAILSGGHLVISRWSGVHRRHPR